MNRKERRSLRKDKDLVKELYSIINKYLPRLLDMFDNLTDTRNKSYITYKMKTICVTRLFGLLCGLTTMTDISSDDFNSDNCIKNLSNICNQNLEEIPYWETIQDVFINIKTDELRSIQKYIVKALIRSKMFDRYRFNGCFQLLFDGTGLSNHDYNLNNNCLIRKHRDGKISYYKYVLECKLVVGNIVISLDSEFIENKKMLTDKQKQDCETNAFKYVETKKNKTTIFRYISNLDIKHSNIKEIISMGRKRWKIENEGFCTQKHRTFNISHLNSRNDTAMKNHYFFIQFAHTIRQLLEQGNLLTKSLNLKIKEVSKLLLKSLTSNTSDLNNLKTKFQLRFDD